MPSHLNLFMALGESLATRGHHLTFFGISDNAGKVRGAGFDFQSVDPESVPLGTLGRMMRELSALPLTGSLRLHGRLTQLQGEGILEKGPGLVRAAGLDAMIVDEAEPHSGTVAEAAGLPWASIASALTMSSGRRLPPTFTSWSCTENRFASFRNQLVYAAMDVASGFIGKRINRHRRRFGLRPLKRLEDCFSPFAQINQQVAEFDFPGERPRWCHYVGPIQIGKRAAVAFPWERLDQRPLIYASLGTLVHHEHVYRAIAEGCTGMDAQLVVGLGGTAAQEEYGDLPGNPLVVTYAPQLELLKRASLTITHGGLNTTLESLSVGVPIVAIPITFDQPGVAARIRWTGTGDFVRASKVTPGRLRSTIETVMRDPSYRRAAERMRIAIAQTRGAARAADIVEEVIRTGKPVLRG